MQHTAPIKNRFFIILSIIIAGGIIIGAYFFIRERNLRIANDFPNKSSVPDDFSVMEQKGYYPGATFALTSKKNVSSLIFVDTTLTEARVDNDKINLTMRIRLYNEFITYSISTKKIFYVYDFSINAKKVVIENNNLNFLPIGDNFQAIFLYSSNTNPPSKEEISSFCKAGDLATSTEILCLQATEDIDHFEIPYFLYDDNLKIDNASYLKNLFFVGFVK